MSIALAWFIVLSAAVIIILIKLKNIASILIILERIRKSEAELIPTVPKPDNEQAPVVNVNAQLQTEDRLISIIAILIVMQLVVYIAYKWYKYSRKDTCQRCMSKVYLELTNVEKDIKIRLTDLPFALWEITGLELPKVLTVQLNDVWICVPQLMITFDKPMTMTGFNHTYTIRLPSQIKISNKTAKVLSKMINQRESLQLQTFIRIVNECKCTHYITTFDDHAIKRKADLYKNLRKGLSSHPGVV